MKASTSSAPRSVYSPPDGTLEPITRDTNRYVTLTLSAEGKSAASVQVKTTHSLALRDAHELAKGDAALKPRPQVAGAQLVQWTPDGKLLVSDGDKITRMDPDGQNATVLVSDPGASILSFSPCGDHYCLLPWAYHQGNTTVVWRTNADGSAPRQLTSQSFATDPICTPDGKWVYYLERPPGRLMRVPIDGARRNRSPAVKSQTSSHLGLSISSPATGTPSRWASIPPIP